MRSAPALSDVSRQPFPLALLLVVAFGLAISGCVSEEATPIDEVRPSDSSVPDDGTPHLLQPTEQMQELAEQQCRDDPDLDQGEVVAVDPASPDQTLSQVVVDCDGVRG